MRSPDDPTAAPDEPPGPGARHGAVVAAAGVAWLLGAALTVGLAPLSAGEADLLAAAGTPGPPWHASPLGALLLWLVGRAGPPAEVLHRLVGLGGVGLLALATRGLAVRLGGSPRAGALAGLCLVVHGTVLLGGALLAAAASLLFATAISLLAALAVAERDTPARRAGLGLASALLVAAEPVGVVLVGGLALWLGRLAGRPAAAALALASASALLAGLWALGGLGWAPPSVPAPMALFFEVARRLLGLGVGDGAVGRESPFVTIVSRAFAVALLGLAATGFARAGPALRTVCLALVATAAVRSLVRGAPDGLDGGVALLLAPLLVLGAVRLEAARPTPDAAVWLVLLLGLSAWSGGRVLGGYRHEETRAAAAAIGPDERPVAADPALRRAVAYHLGEARTEGALVKVHRASDREPRAVAAHTFGRRLGRLWLLRPGRPAYDFGERLEDAEVLYTEAGRTVPCPWREHEARFFCGGPEYQYVAQGEAVFDRVRAEAIFVHPLDEGLLEIRWRDVPLGRRVVGVAGLDDGSIDFSNAEVDLEVAVADLPPLRLKRGRRRGLLPFEATVPAGRARGDLVLRVTAADDRSRHLYVDALAVW